MPVAAVYARVSTDDQAEHGTSLDTQIERCRERAYAIGATSIVEFIDEGVSGSLLERPALSRLRALVANGGCDLVVIWDPDRFARKLTLQMLMAEEIEKAGARLEFVNFEWKNTPDGRLFFSLRGAIAEYEREKIRERSMDGKRARARLGGLVSVPHGLYGYRYHREHKQLIPVPDEGQVVREIYERALDEGTWKIAGWLNERAIPSRRGGKWSQAAVLAILRNRTYTGHLDQMGVGVHLVPAIVDEALWNRVQGVLSDRLNHRPGHPKYEYLLAGRLTCAGCGRAMFGGYGNGSRQRYYVCGGKRQQPLCPSHLFESRMADQAVWQAIARFLDQPALIHEVVSEDPECERLAKDIAVVEFRLKSLDGERQRILRLARREVIGEDDAERQLREIKQEEVGLMDRRTALERARQAGQQREETAKRLEELLIQHASGEGLDLLSKRRILRLLEVGATLGPERNEIHLTVAGASMGLNPVV